MTDNSTDLSILDGPNDGRDDRPPVHPLAAPTEPASEIGQLIRLALQAGQTPTELYAILKEERAARAKQAFNEAMAAFQKECPPVTEGRKTKASTKGFGYAWADLNDLLDVIRPIAVKHGLCFTHTLDADADGKQWVVCWARHNAGHAEASKFPFTEDGTGSMVGIQKAGSGMEYGMRYSLRMATGIRLIGVDDDGASTGDGSTDRLSDAQVETILNLLIETNGKVADFAAIYGVAGVADIPAKMFDPACDVLNKRAAARRGKS